MIAMPRSRPLYLVLLMSLAALSYLSFDTFIRPVIVGLPSPASLPTVKDSVGTITLPNSKHLAPPPSILLVSAFFPLSHSKHSCWITSTGPGYLTSSNRSQHRSIFVIVPRILGSCSVVSDILQYLSFFGDTRKSATWDYEQMIGMYGLLRCSSS